MRRFLLILAVLALLAAGAVEWVIAAWNAPGPAAPRGNQTVVLIAPGTSLHRIAEYLGQNGVVSYPLVFELGLRATRQGAQVKAGEYAISSRASMKAIAAILVAGKSIQHKLTAAEGLTSQMIHDLVVNDRALSGDAGPVPPEGTLLPETYLFTRGTSRRKILDEMKQAQRKYLDAQWAHRADGLPFGDSRQAVTLASVVEKETALPEERRHHHLWPYQRLSPGAWHPPERARQRHALQHLSIFRPAAGADLQSRQGFHCRGAASGKKQRYLFRRHRQRRPCLLRQYCAAPAQCRGPARAGAAPAEGGARSGRSFGTCAKSQMIV
jgi:hypothetical protein